jgi:tRNA(Arg) A34 adenosine deaminase TadA
VATPFPGLDHATFMRRAIAQANNVPLLPFGAVLVRGATGEVLAEGHNRSGLSPTFHGEVDVINRLAADQPQIDWSGLALYTTAEPCPMCQSAIEWAGIPLVVYGSSIPFLQDLDWWQIDIRALEVVRRTPFRQTTVLGGILEKECNALFEAVPRKRGE